MKDSGKMSWSSLKCYQISGDDQFQSPVQGVYKDRCTSIGVNSFLTRPVIVHWLRFDLFLLFIHLCDVGWMICQTMTPCAWWMMTLLRRPECLPYCSGVTCLVHLALRGSRLNFALLLLQPSHCNHPTLMHELSAEHCASNFPLNLIHWDVALAAENSQ